MFGYLKGTLLAVNPGQVVLGVGSELSGWVGYSVHVPQRPGEPTALAGRPAEYFIHTHVREDALDLYGFPSSQEREIFLTLVSVSGIGPRSALGILSRVEPFSLLEWISAGDSGALTSLPGIGKKTAERMVVELGDSVRKKLQAGEFGPLKRPLLSTRGSGAVTGGFGAETDAAVRDAREALIGLGFREMDAARVLAEIVSKEGVPESAEVLVRLALRHPGR